ncbi:Protein of unknown function [Flavobacterium indicum GPTSA100-9 = DSM 17447]|uniref:Tetratricopeptide repeat protein n=1 Tax=Flavobacterium indicum (strain DSM 17447 / CIP 109464 / GPTSA100-9) TaxID=1094466 RepID=H8XUF6_FLAIG|nr:hypothetical protein [Flavobacterium indicum]CCG52939.1 Protein of unknown function [Flavobacterium indicum GPTSA100-9 = DSM 17447]
MTKLISTFVFFVATLVAHAQSSYEKGMANGLTLWKAGKNAEAIAQFERIASVEKNNWLPNYYITIITTFSAFGEQDKNKMKSLLEAAQKTQNILNALEPNNPEVLVSQAMIHTAWIVFDPMTYGQQLYGEVIGLYEKAAAIAPTNPRVVFNKASFEKGGAEYFGTDTTPMCEKMKKSIELFATFKPETPFHPTWGVERAKQEAANCN